MTAALRLGVVGATGTLGEELLLVLEEARLDLAELRPFAGKRSMGDTVEFAGASLPVLSGEVDFTGLDAVILCTPPAVSLELIRQALRVEAPCIDCSGALLASPEVPLVIADLGAHDGVSAAPLLASPTGTTLVWGPVLSALQREAGLVRVVGTVLHSASSAGRAGIELLSEQTLALIGQQERAEGEPLEGPMAFASVPHERAVGEEKDGAALRRPNCVLRCIGSWAEAWMWFRAASMCRASRVRAVRFGSRPSARSPRGRLRVFLPGRRASIPSATTRRRILGTRWVAKTCRWRACVLIRAPGSPAAI